jgi:hypothetical protein
MKELLGFFLICACNAHFKWEVWQNANGAVGFAAAGTMMGILL